MADEEKPQDGLEEAENTHDDLTEVISTLAPGVSASGILAAASAMRGLALPSNLKSSSAKNEGVDEISEDDLEDDLGDLALKPVERTESQSSDKGRTSRLSNISR